MPRLPPPVRPGDRIGVAALSGPVDPRKLRRGLAALERLGFEPVPAANLSARHHLFAGSDGERLEAFHELAADPSVRAVLFARGGYGAMRVLPRLDWELLAAHPRAYVGYSDLTPFLASVVRRLDLVAFHGPMVAADLARGLSRDEETSLLNALAGGWEERFPVEHWVREGSAEGPLAGGCLSLLTATLGTPWAAPLDGAILFWEDLEEPLYRLDRMLTHLALSDTLTGLRGMVVGHCTPTDADGSDTEESRSTLWLESLREAVATMPGPVATGLAVGHQAPNLTLPLGVRALLDPRADGLLVESATALPTV